MIIQLILTIYVFLQLLLIMPTQVYVIKMGKTMRTMQVEMLKSWEGDKKKLGNAERFILQLIGVQK
jgi:hypothetical protein